MRFFISLLLALLLLFSCQYYNTFFNAEQSFNKALNEINQMDARITANAAVFSYASARSLPKNSSTNLELSIKQAWKVIEIYSDSAEYADDAIFLIGRAHFFLKDYSKSTELFSDLIDRYPESKYWAESWLWLADGYAALGDTLRAVNSLERAFTRDFPQDIRLKLLTRRGLLAASAGSHELAIGYYEEALDFTDGDDFFANSIRLLLARSYHALKDYDNALLHATIAYEQDVDTELTREALRQIILTYIAKKDLIYTLTWLEEARSDFDNVDDYSWYDLQRGHLFLEMGRWPEAKDQWLSVFEDNPNSLEGALAAYNIAEYYRLEEGNYDSAYVYIRTISANALADRPDLRKNLEIWTDKLEKTVKLRRRIYIDSMLLSIALSDTAFYLQESNFSFLMQEAQLQLQRYNPFSFVEKKRTTRPTSTNQGATNNSKFGAASMTESGSEDKLDEYYNTDSLASVTEQLRNLIQNEESMSGVDSAAVDSLQMLVSAIEKNLFTNRNFSFANLSKVKQDYREAIYEIAESMLIEFEDYLSAEYYYRSYLNEFPNDTLRGDRALFAIGYIEWSQRLNPEENRYFDEVLEKYPDSPSAAKVLELRNIATIDSAQLKRNNFEKKYHDAQVVLNEGLPDSSLTILEELKSNLPNSADLARILLMQAYIFRDYKGDIDSTYQRYSQIASDFKDSEYFTHIQPQYSVLKEYYAGLDSVVIDSTNTPMFSDSLQQIETPMTEVTLDSAVAPDAVPEITATDSSTVDEARKNIEEEEKRTRFKEVEAQPQ
jgi:tetratricopeptide (TPR) repeat protein